MKKNWINPELSELNLTETNCYNPCEPNFDYSSGACIAPPTAPFQNNGFDLEAFLKMLHKLFGR